MIDDDDDLLDENNDLNHINYNSRRGGGTQAAKKPAQQQQKQSDFNYNDIEFSDDDILKESVPKQQQNNQKRGSDIDDIGFGNPQKNQYNNNSNSKQQSALPPIQNNSSLPSINKPVSKQPISLNPFKIDEPIHKPAQKKEEQEFDDLDDLDDIYEQSHSNKKQESPIKTQSGLGKTEVIKSKPNFGKANIKQEQIQKQQENNSFEDLDDNYYQNHNSKKQESPAKPQSRSGVTEAIKSKPNFGKQNIKQEPIKQYFEEEYNEGFDDDKVNKNKGEEEPLSSLSDLPDIDQASPKYESQNNNNKNLHSNNQKKSDNNFKQDDNQDEEEEDNYKEHKEAKPFSIQNKKNEKAPSKQNLPPQQQKTSAQQKRNANDSADRLRKKSRELSSGSLRRNSENSLVSKPANNKAASREATRNKIPPSSSSKSQPKSRQFSAGKMFKMLNMQDLEKLLEEKNYDHMSFKDLKIENESLREKLKQFNQQLTEKIEHNQTLIQKQAIQQNSSNQTRSRSNQMRTADAEQENNMKIMKRLQEEYDKLESRLLIVEDQSYVSKLKQQIESAKLVINKFKVDIKHIILKNDQQAKELSKIDRGDGIPGSVKESHNLKIEIQQYVNKINELQKRKEEIEDMFKKKADQIEIKDKEFNEKAREAKQLNVDVSLQSNSYKRKEKYKDLQKDLENLIKSNQTAQKLCNTKENIQKRELEEVQREIQNKDDEINQMEIEIMELKNRISDRIDKEKTYSSNLKEIFNKLPESNVGIYHHRSTDSLNRNKNLENSLTPVKHNNLFSPSSKNSSNSKPNLKFIKKENYAKKEEKSKERKGSSLIKDEVETESINFHQKIHSKSNLNQNQIDSDSKEEVISKPFNFKKNNNQEARVWKPEDNLNSNNNLNSNSNLQQSPLKNQLQTPTSQNIDTPQSFNFKKKNDQQSDNNQLKQPQQGSQQQLLSNDNLINKQQSQTQLDQHKEQEDVFSKPQRMFKFKKENNNESTHQGGSGDYNPLESIGKNNQAQNQQQIQPQKQEDEGYNFSANSRVSRVRQKGGAVQGQQNDQQQLSKIEEEKSKIENEQPIIPSNEKQVIVGGGYNPSALTQNNNPQGGLGGGYAFSGLDSNKNANQNSLNNISDSYQPTAGVSRRRQGAGSNMNNNDINAGYMPSTLAAQNNLDNNQKNNEHDIKNNFNSFGNNNQTSNNLNSDKQQQNDDFNINAVSRRRGGANQQKDDNSNNIAGEYNFSRNQASNNEQKPNNKPDDNKWSWNTGNDNTTNNNNMDKFGQNNNQQIQQNNENKQTSNLLNKNNNDDKWSWDNNGNSNLQGKGGINQASNWNNNTYGMNNNNNNNNFNSQSVQEQPKQFNFKKNQEEQQQIKQDNENKQDILTIKQQIQQEQPKQHQQQQQQLTQPQQIKKQEDDVIFQGPNDRRRVNKKPNAAEAAKVQKRDIFGGGGDSNDQQFSLAAPKEVGGAGGESKPIQQSAYQPSGMNQKSNNKSPFDDDDDGSGLDFLKQDKPKVNYNDDEDDDFFGKKSSKPANQQPSQLGLGTKKNQENKQEREKQLASKAQNNDFFGDLI
ncbi:hypothetical protein ABPG72_005739 [Tetrahymena utriculariae]